jgi:hypothetical protein
VSLEFNKVIEQVQRMGRYEGKRSLSRSDRLELALDRFYALTDLTPIHDRIHLVRTSGVSGYRGATPLPQPYSEIIAAVGDAPPMPDSATLIAADGSQIYPDQHESSLYYLVNIGIYIYHHGAPRLPAQLTSPELVYAEKQIKDSDGRVINNQTVNARRTVTEMEWLAKQAAEYRDEARPLVTLHDGPLLKFFGATEVTDAHVIERRYMEALHGLYDVRAVLCGYISNPRSTSLISLIHLMGLADSEINEVVLKTNGDLEGLTDEMLLSYVLAQPGQRSAMMTQNSPQNAEYKAKGAEYEIAFFYANVAPFGKPVIARVDVPLWVAREPAVVDALHALLLHQCGIQGRKHYPYALTRADELAVVSTIEKDQLNHLINVELLKNGIVPERSHKLQTKGLARGERRQHRLRG